MARQHYQKGQIWQNLLPRMLLCTITTIIVVLLLPHSNKPKLDIQLNQPWLYDQIIADEEIPLLKSEELLQSERDSMLEKFEPYYNISVAVREQALQRFKNKYGNGLPGLSREYAAYVANRIRQAYDMGIVSSETGRIGQKDSLAHIRVINGNTATSVRIDKFMTPITAYEWLIKDPKMQKQYQLLQQCNLNEFLEPNIIYDSDRSQVEMNDMLSLIPVASGIIKKGEKIIDRGEVVNEQKFNALNGYAKALEQRTTTRTETLTTYSGQFLYVFIIILIFTLYLVLYRNDYFDKTQSYAMLYSLIIILPAIVSQVMQHHFFTVYVLPLCMAPMFVRIFMDSRTAFLTHTVIVMLSAIAVQKQFDFIAIELIGGLVAIYTLRELSNRSQVFTAALTVAIAEAAVYTALQLIHSTTTVELNTGTYYHFVGNAVLLLLTYPLMFIVEKTFGFTSAVTLFELSDTNKNLLRRLSEVAPGTMQHSITVSNLASEIASRIGAKPLEVRVGALYHDIGKLRHPVFFTENQAGINPHKRISEVDSAQVVISHVTEGLRLAEKEDLPTLIQDFIRTHHGSGMAKYFYVQYKNNHPDEEIDEELFHYPGPNPFTREQAILMMADAVEAASRSLSEYTEESISALVNKLIDGQVNEGFFHDCPITFHDVQTAKEVLIERLKAIYHTRIAYPEMKSRKENGKENKETEKEENKEKEQKEQ